MVVESVSRAFRVTKDNFRAILPLALVFTAPAAVANLADTDPLDAYVPPVVAIAAVLSLVSYLVLQGALAHFILHRLEGRNTAVDSSLRLVLPRLGSLAVALFLSGLAVLGGTILLVVPGCVVGIGLALVVPVVVIEGVRGTAALRRSWNLTKGHKWSILGAYLLVFVPLWMITVPAGLALNLGVMGHVSPETLRPLLVGYHVVLSVVGLFWTPFIAALAVVLYHDLRVLKDGGRDFPGSAAG